MCPGCDLHFQTYVEPPNRAPTCAGATARLAEAWPPDGRLVPVDIEGIVDPDGDPVRIEATGVTQDEPPGGACPSAVIVDGAARVRASRLGSGNGRVYVVAFVARDGRGGECSGSVRVCVPHDRGRGSVCVDDGQTVDALDPCGAERAVGPAETCVRVLRGGGTTAVLEYSLPMDAEVLLSVYDVAGRKVRTLKRAHDTAGVHQVSWDTGGIVAGVYFYRLQIGDQTTGGPLIVIR
jgi:hypothetical protein